MMEAAEYSSEPNEPPLIRCSPDSTVKGFYIDTCQLSPSYDVLSFRPLESTQGPGSITWLLRVGTMEGTLLMSLELDLKLI